MKLLTLLLGATILALASFNATAECSSSEIRNLIRQGMTDHEIDVKCSGQSAYPEWLSGIWEYYGHFTEGCGPMGAGCGRIIGTYKIEVNGDSFNLYKVEEDYLVGLVIDPRLRRLEVVNEGIRNNTLTFTEINGDSKTTYILNNLSAQKMNGTISHYWESRYGLPTGNLSGQISFKKIQ